MREPRSLQEAVARLERMHATQRGARVIAPLAEAYRIERRLAEAEATARDGVRDFPESISTRVVLARVIRDLGRHEEAREAFRDVVGLDPENMEAILFIESTPDPKWEQTNGDTVNRDEATADGNDRPSSAEEAATAGNGRPAFAEDATADERREPAADAPGGSELPRAGEEPVSLSDELAHLSDLFGPSPSGNVDQRADDGLEGIATLTLAEIYARQGLPDKAIEVCELLLGRDPANDEVRGRLEEYRRALAESR